ncbi:alpha/beta hydrolase [Octadecabacter sp. SW4]|uniref:alpha/beta hydrolase n=1 Tax=Octadecabacter sp. SW4 TaxID=2602067 RepID=UPI0011C1FFC3|nr:alpha/beta hydrolase [Octadecabacter sp. SW4]QEE36177.1 alpha/beta hydrolase [Octadecabacter sp. SW4]
MEQAPFFADIADGPDGGVAHWLRCADGHRIRVGHWPLASAKGTVLLFPGRTEYIEKYGRAAQDLAQRGYATLAIDWRGQGIADRVHDNPAVGHVGRFEDYQLDAQAAVAHARELGLPEPFFLLGHSMGGCIGLRSLYEDLPVAAACFSAPMWGIQMAAPLRPLAWGLSTVSRSLGFSHAFAPGQVSDSYIEKVDFSENTLTSDRDMFDYMKAQLTAHPEFSLGGASLHWLNESLREMRGLSLRAAPNVPCVSFLGSDELIVDPDRIVARMRKWPQSELVMIPHARHEVMMETPETRKLVFDKACALFDAQSPVMA